MNQNESYQITGIPRTIGTGQSVSINIKLPKKSKSYRCKLEINNEHRESIEIESGQDNGTIDFQAPQVVCAELPLTIIIEELSSKKGGKQAYDEIYRKTYTPEVTSTPLAEQVFKSMDEMSSAIRQFPKIPTVNVSLAKSHGGQTANQALWVAIRNRSKAISFSRYSDFIDNFLSVPVNAPNKEGNDQNNGKERLARLQKRIPNLFHGIDAYKTLKTATEIFLLLECGVWIDDDEISNNEEMFRIRQANNKEDLMGLIGSDKLNGLPYINRILDTVFQDQEPVTSPYSAGILQSTVDRPCLLELIWSYWHEEGGLVQTMNAISLRFQNKRGPGARDPLAQLEIDPLRPLNNLLWGYVQEENARLSIARRASEYQHHYGFTLMGKAVPKLRLADNRSKFIEAFHTLLFRTWTYYQEVADTHVVPDGFPLLNSLKEVHMLLAEGAHNQFGDLPWTSRVEMLIQQWLLARPEMQDFLRGRAMVPYKEPWMGPADTMKKLQGWTDVPVSYFRDLGVFGEQLLLSVRYEDWIDDTKSEDDAKNWADYWKQEAQGYMHAYRAATGVDLTNAASARERVDTMMPAVHLHKRERHQARRAG